MNPYRKLLVLATNHLIETGAIDLNSQDDLEGHVHTELAGRKAVIQWNGIGFGEVRVSVWWDYNHDRHPQANAPGNSLERFVTARPLAKRSHYPKFVGVTASCWLERRDGKYLQGVDDRGIYETYARRGEMETLKALPEPTPIGYAAEGAFHL